MYKPDYEPILAVGRHEMTLNQFERQFVHGIGGESRTQIWKYFQDHIATAIISHDIKCEIWLDGSFITKCPEPSDIDGSLMIYSDHLDLLDEEALEFLKHFDDCAPPFQKSLDLFLSIIYPLGHPLRGEDSDPDGWAEQWSKERNSSWLKGFVVVPFR